MQILIDSREQDKLTFSHEYVTESIRLKLDVGDYGCRFSDGYIPPVFFERKALGDLFSTMGAGYDRFRRELKRAKSNDYKLILIVEGSMGKVLKGFRHSKMSGLTLFRKLLTLWMKYDLVPVFCKTREEMSMFIVETFCSIGRLYMKGEGRSRKETDATSH